MCWKKMEIEFRRTIDREDGMGTIKRFFECLIPVTACNLKCNYCYVIQRNNRKHEMAQLKYTPEQIGRALRQERLGGICYFSICGSGETTLQKDIEEIVFHILREGHYVNITTNGTIGIQLKKIIHRAQPYISRLHFAFSFHYLELMQRGLIDDFFDNVNMIRRAGASIVVQLNLCDEYIPYLPEIEKICLERIGAKPQLAATRKEDIRLRHIELLTEYSEDEYIKLGERFDSPLFRFTMKNFNIQRKEFCYAGDWSGVLDLSTGIMRRCYSSYIYQDIFRNPEEKIRFLAVGNCCGSPFCMNSSHFMAIGVIPEIDTPSYADLRNRKEASWYTKDMYAFLSGKLCENNEEYKVIRKKICNLIGTGDGIVWGMRNIYKRIKKKGQA